MHVISTSSYLSQRHRISEQIADSVPTLLTDVVNLISNYADENSDAELPLEFDHNGNLLSNEINNRIIVAIKNVLTSSHDPERKKIIFKNLYNIASGYPAKSGESLLSNSKAADAYRSTLNKLFNEIRSVGHQVNLDYTDFTNISLCGMQLAGSSAIGAKFVNGIVMNSTFRAADFTGAVFQNIKFDNCYFEEATFYKSILTKCYLTDCSLRAVTMAKLSMLDVDFDRVYVYGVVTDNEKLAEIISRSHQKIYSALYPDPHYRDRTISKPEISNTMLSGVRLTL